MSARTIRALDSPDATAYRALRLRGLQECPEAFASSHEEEVDTPIAVIGQRLRPTPGAAVFGAFQDGTLCAVAGIQREGLAKLSHKAVLWGVYVAPEARGRGVGAALLTQVLDHAASAPGLRQVNLSVHRRNTAALALYRKLGFVEYGLERDCLFVDGVFHDECLMVRRVAGVP